MVTRTCSVQSALRHDRVPFLVHVHRTPLSAARERKPFVRQNDTFPAARPATRVAHRRGRRGAVACRLSTRPNCQHVCHNILTTFDAGKRVNFQHQ
eukprot:1683709-Prymnesium_polylepis.1